MFAERLRALRLRKNLTQQKMANALNTAQTTYSGWEKDKEPNYAKLKEIANFFDVTIDYLLENETHNKNSKISKLERELTEAQIKKLEEMCKVMFTEEYKKIDD